MRTAVPLVDAGAASLHFFFTPVNHRRGRPGRDAAVDGHLRATIVPHAAAVARPLSALRPPCAAARYRQPGAPPRPLPGSGAASPAPQRGGGEPGRRYRRGVGGPWRRRSGWGGRDARRRGAPWENPRAPGMAAAAGG